MCSCRIGMAHLCPAMASSLSGLYGGATSSTHARTLESSLAARASCSYAQPLHREPYGRMVPHWAVSARCALRPQVWAPRLRSLQRVVSQTHCRTSHWAGCRRVALLGRSNAALLGMSSCCSAIITPHCGIRFDNALIQMVACFLIRPENLKSENPTHMSFPATWWLLSTGSCYG